MATIDEQHAALDLERKALELEVLRDTVADKIAKRADIAKKRAKQEADLAANSRIKSAREAACKHRKGGRDLAGLNKGNDTSNYSIIVNTYPWGEKRVHCQRCGKVWTAPPKALRQSDPDEYVRQLTAYNAALEWPTDNEPSGTQMFLIRQAEAPAPRAPRELRAAKPRAKRPPKTKAA